MKAVVTGGAGFMGSHIVGQLTARGDRVVVVDDFSTGCEENLSGTGVDVVFGEITTRGTLQAATRGADVVFHLAASVGNVRSIEHPLKDASVNLLGTINVLEAASERREDGVYSSSTAIFGERSASRWMRRTRPAQVLRTA